MMKTKLVTSYWMDVEGYPYQGTLSVRKPRYLGSLIGHCEGSGLPVVCYTHQKNFDELLSIKKQYGLDNLEIKILELNQIKYHKDINRIREKKFDTDLDGRGPEIMWGKFDILERELDGYDRVYWVDVGLQHPGIFPWRYSKVYDRSKIDFGIPRDWWASLDVFNFSKFIDSNFYKKLDLICQDKIMFVTSYGPQIGYPFLQKGILHHPFESPYPVAGMIGGDTKVVKKYVKLYWDFCEKVLQNEFLCVEEAIMKPTYDMLNEDEKISFVFESFSSGEHDDFHYEMWNENKNTPKPFYMVWQDILNFNI